MARKIIVIATTLALLPCFCTAATYNCVLKEKKAKAGEKKDVWSGKIVLKDGESGDAAVFIIKKDGTSVSVKDVTKNAGDAKAIIRAMQPYNGLLVIGLRKMRKNAGSLDVNLGHVDSTNDKNSAPMDVDGWASIETKEIGVTDVRKGLTVLCRLE